jgi:hypothetical protein
MNQDVFPASIEALTSNWLTRVLKADEVLTVGAVSGFTVEAFPSGYTSSVYRLLLEYEPDVANAPQSLVVKFHGDSAETRELFEGFDIYQKEVRFYQFLGDDPALPVPICYAAEFDPVNGDFVLLMEDLSDSRPVCWDDDGIEDTRTALLHLAKIHAKFWGDPRLQQYDWIAKPTDLINPPPSKRLWAANFARVKKQFADQLSEYSWSVCNRWLESWDEVMACMSQDTHTLVHTDPHFGQMFFPVDESQRFVLFDWQYPSKSWGAEDAVHLIVSELSVKSRRKHESFLLDFYYDALCQHGVNDLTKQRFWFQCKLSLLWHCFMNFNVVVQPGMLQSLEAEADEAGEDWREWVFGQLGTAIEDWKLAETLDHAIEEARDLQ